MSPTKPERGTHNLPAEGNTRQLEVLNALVARRSQEDKFAEALDLQWQVVELAPANANAWFNLGVLQSRCNQVDEALESYAKALQLNADFSLAYYNLGVILRQKGDHLAAIHCNQQVIRLDPGHLAATNNLAVSCIAIKNFPAVSEYALKALAIDPAHADSFYHLGIACNEQGNLAEGLTFLRRALALNPTNNNIRVGLSFAELANGNLLQGWHYYESRWFKETNPEKMRHFPYPWWQGESLRDKTILVWGEQGIGDQIMFGTMIADLAARAGQCVLACAKKLVPIFQRTFPTVNVIDLDDKAALLTWHDSIDVQCPIGSLARWLRGDLASFENRSAYLVADRQRVAYWQGKLAELGPEPKVGICWRSSNVSGDRIFYCTQIEQWRAVFAVPGVRFINLQYDDCTEELKLAKDLFGVTVYAFDEVDLFDDIDETSALTKALDLVIAAPTTSAILAGALGVPTWMLVSGFSWDYLGTDHLCWCPGIVSIRRPWTMSWETLLESVGQKLKSCI